jgi:SAM-dependent methyltransferase
MVGLRDSLSIPQVYQAFQTAGGFFGARLRSMQKYLEIPEHARIIDVGCGPGFLRQYLPETCIYHGFDTDQRYIDWAKRDPQPNASYECRIFDRDAAAKLAPVDVIMMNGLLHHLTDQEARELLAVSAASLAPGGKIFTLDGCYTPGQSLFRKKMLDWDRGRYVRTQGAYESLFPSGEVAVRSHVDEDFSRVAYTFISIIASKR